MTNDILITHCTVVNQGSGQLEKNRYVSIKEGIISACGPMAKCPETYPGTLFDADNKLLMPGLVNSHNHCAMTLFRGLADDLALTAWLHDHIFPAEARHVDPDMVYWCSKLAAAEMILSGTTAVADGYFFSDRSASALRDAGMRAVIAHGIVDFAAPSVPDPHKNIEAVKAFIDRWLGASDRIKPAVFAHAPYTCSPATLERAKQLADDHGVRFFIHLAESRTEPSMILDPQDTSPVRHLAKLGLLDHNCVCVHCVWLDDQDLEILAASGAHVVTCPQSNLKLSSGIARIQDMLDHSISFAIGTDSCASNNSLDMFREMDMLAKIQKSATANATAMPASAVLEKATSGGATVIGLDSCGSLAPGARADIILINTNVLRLTPMYNQDLLVYGASGSDVDSVIVDGRIIMRHREILFFDLEEVYHEVRARADQIYLPYLSRTLRNSEPGLTEGG
ncbi:MAG: amidohydrolase [Deltaproteobacteria bacterium]|nr:amidohydrolase [Deltaproteobacteria bacterium]